MYVHEHEYEHVYKKVSVVFSPFFCETWGRHRLNDVEHRKAMWNLGHDHFVSKLGLFLFCLVCFFKVRSNSVPQNPESVIQQEMSRW